MSQSLSSENQIYCYIGDIKSKNILYTSFLEIGKPAFFIDNKSSIHKSVAGAKRSVIFMACEETDLSGLQIIDSLLREGKLYNNSIILLVKNHTVSFARKMAIKGVKGVVILNDDISSIKKSVHKYLQGLSFLEEKRREIRIAVDNKDGMRASFTYPDSIRLVSADIKNVSMSGALLHVSDLKKSDTALAPGNILKNMSMNVMGTKIELDAKVIMMKENAISILFTYITPFSKKIIASYITSKIESIKKNELLTPLLEKEEGGVVADVSESGFGLDIEGFKRKEE